jgi:catechol 2,3-dioxygenase-like lactoylglutathione lyase family enzyme
MTVPARVSLLTLGVAEVARATAFYQALGWPLSSASISGDVSFFKLSNTVLALWGQDDLAVEASASPGPVSPFRGVALAINVDSPDEVEAALAAAVAAGGELRTPGHPTDWGGYNGYFADPDGHLWEVAHNPGWPLGPDGLPILP